MITWFPQKRVFFFIGILSVYVFLQWSCNPKDPGFATPNHPPIARLANVPVDDPAQVSDTARPVKSPLVQLYWVGNDPDGFVTAFMYRWSFKDSNSSSLVRYRPWTTVLNYVTSNNRVLILDVDSSLAPSLSQKVFKFFSNTALDPDKLTVGTPVYDTSLVNFFSKIDNGETVPVPGVQGARVHASNPNGERYPVHSSPNSGTFIFESNDYYNRHKFEVIAIDNEGAVSQPDSIRFWNRSVEPPKVRFVSLGTPGKDSLFILLDTAAYGNTWHGLRFAYEGKDRNSRRLWFSWKVDNQEWSDWSLNTETYVVGKNIDTPYTHDHTFRVRARNEFGAITIPDSQPTFKFFTIFPFFKIPGYPKRILVVNLSRSSAINTPYAPNQARLTQYYTEVLDSVFGVVDIAQRPYDIWQTFGRGHPKLSQISRYSTIYLISDICPPLPDSRIPSKIYSPYMDVGGNIIYNGVFFRIPQLVIIDAPTMLVGHMQLADLASYLADEADDFIGAIPQTRTGYTDTVNVDTAKINPGELGRRNIPINGPQGFSEILYRFNSVRDSVQFERQPVSIRYLGSSYKTIYFGIPFYFVYKDQSIRVLRKAFRDMGEL